jgi:hypothetical protein
MGTCQDVLLLGCCLIAYTPPDLCSTRLSARGANVTPAPSDDFTYSGMYIAQYVFDSLSVCDARYMGQGPRVGGVDN